MDQHEVIQKHSENDLPTDSGQNDNKVEEQEPTLTVTSNEPVFEVVKKDDEAIAET